MNIKIIAALGGVLILGGAGLVSVLGEQDAPDASEQSVKANASNHANLRVARLVSCPGGKAPAVCQQSQVLGNGDCLCWTEQTETVDGEVRTNTLKLIVCPGKNPVQDPPRVIWYSKNDNVPANCTIAAEPVVDVTVGSYETDLVTQLRSACAPCPVSGTSWGQCPACLEMDGGCAAACP